MIEAGGEEGDSDKDKETEPPAECPAHKTTTTKTAKGVMTDKEVYTNATGFIMIIAGRDYISTIPPTFWLCTLIP